MIPVPTHTDVSKEMGLRRDESFDPIHLDRDTKGNRCCGITGFAPTTGNADKATCIPCLRVFIQDGIRYSNELRRKIESLERPE